MRVLLPLLLLVFVVASAVSTLAPEYGPDPMAFVSTAAAALASALPGFEFELGALDTLHRLRRARLNRRFREQQLGGANNIGTSAKKRREKMRKFKVHVSWHDIKERLNPLEFRRAHGLSSEAFDAVLALIRPLITDEAGGHGGARNGNVLPPEIKLHLTLRWLRGGQFHDFLTPYGVSRTHCYVMFWRVCKAICATHKLPMAAAVAAARCGDTTPLQRWATGFSAFTLGIINTCFGAIDGVQVLIKKPSVAEVPNGNPAQFFNRYNKPTINMQAIADSTARITWISVKVRSPLTSACSHLLSSSPPLLCSSSPPLLLSPQLRSSLLISLLTIRSPPLAV